MCVVDRVISWLSGLAGIAIWFLPNAGFEIKIIICLSIVLACFIYLYIAQVLANKAQLRVTKGMQELLKDVKKKHKAVSKQFEDKQKMIEFYESAVDVLYNLANQVLLSTENDKFLLFFNQFTITKNDLIERSTNDE